MSDGDETFRRLQAIARSVSAKTGVATPTASGKSLIYTLPILQIPRP